MRIAASSLLLVSICSYAQTEKPKALPLISVEIREKFFKAQSEYQDAVIGLREATTKAQVKNSALQEQMEKIKVACGTEYIPNLDKDGEIVCTDKPKIPDSPKK